MNDFNEAREELSTVSIAELQYKYAPEKAAIDAAIILQASRGAGFEHPNIPGAQFFDVEGTDTETYNSTFRDSAPELPQLADFSGLNPNDFDLAA